MFVCFRNMVIYPCQLPKCSSRLLSLALSLSLCVYLPVPISLHSPTVVRGLGLLGSISIIIIISSVVRGLGLLWSVSPPPCGVLWCGGSAWVAVWCGSGCASAWEAVDVIIIIIVIIIMFLSWVNCHRNRACQEHDPRDSCIFDSLMSESWLESVRHCHKHRVRFGRDYRDSCRF